MKKMHKHISLLLLLVSFIQIRPDDQKSSFKETELFTEEEYQTYCAARRLADLVCLAAIKLNENARYPQIIRYVENRKHKNILLYHKSTQQGLYLEFHYNHPSSIHTPWGTWGLIGMYSFSKYNDINHRAWNAFKITADNHNFHEETLRQVGVELTLDVPGKQTNSDYENTCYQVKSIEGYYLPRARHTSNKRFSDDEYKIVKNKWESMTQRYNLEKQTKYDEICAEFSKFYDNFWN